MRGFWGVHKTSPCDTSSVVQVGVRRRKVLAIPKEIERYRKMIKSSTSVDRANPPVFLTRQEAAKVATLSLRTIASAIAAGDLRTIKIGDRRIVRRVDLETYLGSRVG